MERNIEIWVKVKGFEQYLEVSSWGRIKHLEREWVTTERFGKRYLPERITYGYNGTKGYKRVSKSIDGDDNDMSVHVLVALAFIPNPDNLPEVNHKDGVKYHNWIENLEWSTTQDNALHSYRELGRVSWLSKCNFNQETKGRKVRCDTLGMTFPSVRDAANQTGISAFMIYRVCIGKVFQTRGLVFNYI